ncbi:hypothetical protein K140096H11_32170 [Bacteroides intestinalis]|uniref:ORC-CDC6 family AAA ATPase n=1 Tax=Bacteroides intestinalis TaxID=329854 RepID=UPI0011074A39|nr:hypothetical protein [Bacteroides intestinalis]
MDSKYRNPFTLRASEKIAEDDVFLRLFSPEALKQLEDEHKNSDLWNNVVFIQSPPGAGKTTLLRLFMPNVLNMVYRYKGGNESQRSIYQTLKRLDVYQEDHLFICGVYLLIGRDFSYLEDIKLYDDVQKLRIFMALLNARVTLSLLKSIIELKNIELLDLKDVSFTPSISTNLATEDLKCPCTGYDLYEWAAGIEDNICDVLDSVTADKKMKGHSSLFVFSLLKAENFKYKGNSLCGDFLFELDDAHKFTKNQRRCLVEQVVETRLTNSLWIAERMEALSPQAMLDDNNKEGRDYKVIRLNDNKSAVFAKVALSIASKRSDYSRYKLDLYMGLDNVVNSNYDKVYQNIIDVCSKEINEIASGLYEEWFKKIENNSSLVEKAEAYKAILIFTKRLLNKNPLPLFPFTLEEYNQYIDNNLLKLASSLLCSEYNLPLYYGFSSLVNLSTNNIEQFIDFSSKLYEKLIAKTIVDKKADKLDAVEQDKIIKEHSRYLFTELEKLPNGSMVQKFLKRLSKYCFEQSQGRSSYGIVTGFAISKNANGFRMNNSVWYEESEYKMLQEILRICLANNLLYLYPTKQGNKDEMWDVFYLNRWLCAYQNIPFSTGGWRKLSLDELNRWINK